MRKFTWGWALIAGQLLTLATSVYAQDTQAATPTVVAGYQPVTTLGCYKTSTPLVEKQTGSATDGWCQQICGAIQKPVMAITGGTTCFCGDLLPAQDEIVDRSNCNSKCAGFGSQFCGGLGFYQVYLTGIGGDIKTAPNTTTISTTSSSDIPSATSSQATVIVTATRSSQPTNSGGPNKVGIAVGVVVGVVVIGAILGAIFFFLKQRKRKAIEEEHKRNAAVNEFIGGKRSQASSVTDQRLDPSFLSSHRRESIGSIADEMDFSRRILQVRNPDHRSSTASHIA